MTPELNTVLYPVKDLDAAKATFTTFFGVEPHVDRSTTSVTKSAPTRSD